MAHSPARSCARSILLEIDGRDLCREPIEKLKALLAKLLEGQQMSIVLNEHFEEDGAAVYRAACQLGCEGIVSKRLGSVYRRGRSPHWVKVKNPNASAVKQEAEEDWGVNLGGSIDLPLHLASGAMAIVQRPVLEQPFLP